MIAVRGNVECYGCLLFLARSEKDAKQASLKAPPKDGLAKPTGNPAPLRSASKDKERPKEAPVDPGDVKILDQYAQYKRDGNNEAAAGLLAEDATWQTIYAETIQGREQILMWMEEETRNGRKNKHEQPWMRDTLDPSKYRREMKVTFPSKATHEVVQIAALQGGYITSIVIKPKYPALAVAIAFAQARANTDDDAALKEMSEDVEWKAWDGHVVKGKDAVRRLFREQKGREVKREGTTEFEAAQVNEVGGMFERSLLIERVDHIKVRSTQRLYIKGELTEMPPVSTADGKQRQCWGMVPKIVQVKVLASEEMIDGKWVKINDPDHD